MKVQKSVKKYETRRRGNKDIEHPVNYCLGYSDELNQFPNYIDNNRPFYIQQKLLYEKYSFLSKRNLIEIKAAFGLLELKKIK